MTSNARAQPAPKALGWSGLLASILDRHVLFIYALRGQAGYRPRLQLGHDQFPEFLKFRRILNLWPK